MLPDDSYSQARIFYLATLAIVIAAGVVYAYRGRLGVGLQHAAIWVLIFAGIMLAYGFREPLMNQISPDRAARIGTSTVELRRADDGHFYASVEVNGKDIRFVVDTGASSLVLSRRDAERAGIVLAGLDFSLPTDTANGRVFAAPVRLDRVEFGGFTDRDVRAMVNGGESNESLLGMEYLNRFRSVRIEGDTLLLVR